MDMALCQLMFIYKNRYQTGYGHWQYLAGLGLIPAIDLFKEDFTATILHFF